MFDATTLLYNLALGGSVCVELYMISLQVTDLETVLGKSRVFPTAQGVGAMVREREHSSSLKQLIERIPSAHFVSAGHLLHCAL